MQASSNNQWDCSGCLKLGERWWSGLRCSEKGKYIQWIKRYGQANKWSKRIKNAKTAQLECSAQVCIFCVEKNALETEATKSSAQKSFKELGLISFTKHREAEEK